MYNCILKIYLVNSNEMNETIESIPPLEKFTHEFKTCDSIDEISADETDMNTVIIINNSPNLTAQKIIPFKKNDVTLVLMTDDVESLMESVLNMFNYVWNLPLNPPVMRHHFKKILKDLKLKKEYWLTQNYLNTLINSVPDLIWFKRKDGIHLKVNEAFCEAVNKDRDDVEGYEHAHIWGLTEEQIASGAYDCSKSEIEVMNAGTTLIFHEEVYHSKRGMIQLGVYKTPIKDEYGRAIGTVGFAQDITKLMEQQETILKMAQTDALTQLTNRRYFYEYVNENRGENMITLCYIDLDHFKLVNDNYGHPLGDAALMGTAEVLKNTFPDELVTRLGGDEFVVTIIGDYKFEDLLARLKYLTEQAKDFYKMNKAFETLAMSIGIAWTDDSKIMIDSLLRMSDEALYYCKTHNRGGYIFYEDIKDKVE